MYIKTIYVYLHLCIYKDTRARAHTHTHTHTHQVMESWRDLFQVQQAHWSQKIVVTGVCVCVCVCVMMMIKRDEACRFEKAWVHRRCVCVCVYSACLYRGVCVCVCVKIEREMKHVGLKRPGFTTGVSVSVSLFVCVCVWFVFT